MAQNLELDAWHRGAINNNTFGFENAYIFTTVVLKLICMGSSINHVYRQIATLLHKPYLVNVSKNGMGHMGGPPTQLKIPQNLSTWFMDGPDGPMQDRVRFLKLKFLNCY